jgi:hypothetical protein
LKEPLQILETLKNSLEFEQNQQKKVVKDLESKMKEQQKKFFHEEYQLKRELLAEQEIRM